MSSSAGVVILEMARHFSTQEALEVIMCEDDPSSSSEDSEADMEEGSEIESDQLGSNSDTSEDSSEDESGGEMEEATREWTSKNGQIVWSPTNAETFRYVPAATGFIPGPTHYSAARISDLASSFALLLTDEILQHIVAMTNLHGMRSIADWRDLDVQELQAYLGLLILAGVYRSRNESTLSLWNERFGRSIFRATMSQKRFHHISRALRFDDKLSRPRRRNDKLAAFRKVWDMWTHRVSMVFNESVATGPLPQPG